MSQPPREYVETVIESVETLIRNGFANEDDKARLYALTAPPEPSNPANPGIVAELERLAEWVRHGEYDRDDARDEIARAIEYRARQLAKATPPNYEIAESERIAWARMDLDARLTELVEWIKQGTPDAARARIHALTRKFTMSDEDLYRLEQECFQLDGEIELHALRDLRDRYEERGKYAPGVNPNDPS